MSTNGVIARSTGEGTFTGRYHHWDSYPKDGLGSTLVELYRGFFNRGLDKMLRVLLDEHPAGWSTIVHKDFTLKPGFTNVGQRPEGMSCEEFANQPLNRRPQCYCHGHRHEEEQCVTEKDDCGASWAYVFETVPAQIDGEPDQKLLHVLTREKNTESGEWFWNEVGRIDLNSDEQINWVHIECGEKFERCSHYAWVHFPHLKGTDVGIQQYLGNEPFRLSDAVGFIIDGKRVKNTGCGSDLNYLSRFGSRVSIRHVIPPNCRVWVATIQYQNGRRADVPVAIRGPEGEKPYPGVQWVFPPTLKNQNVTVVG